METTVLRAAEAIKGQHATIYTIGLGETSDINAPLLRQVASDSAKYYETPDAEELRSIYAEIAEIMRCPSEYLPRP